MQDSVIQDIKDRLDIAEVLGAYIQLKRSGTNYKAVCPFHNEKTPSLMVSPQKQIWHCFGCGEGGDIFGFVTRIENIGFRDALKLLADKAGVTLPNYSPAMREQDDQAGRLVRINKFAAAFYHQYLLKQPAAKIALTYLTDRGLSPETIETWQIGFAPDEFHALEIALQKNQVPQNDLIAAGVSVKNDRGQIYDRFRNRITFPIFNYYGEVVGFSARILDAQAEAAKYVNSPETFIYDKSSVLFGLHLAKDSIRKSDQVVIVEGQMDAISAHQAGFSNTVASSGTALTFKHLKQIGRLTKNVKFCFDADSAGSNATRKAGELALSQGFKVKVIELPEGKDPDELIKADPAAWKSAVTNSVWFMDYYIARASSGFAYNSVEQKRYVSDSVIPLLFSISDPIEQDHYIQKISTTFAIDERTLRQNVKDKATQFASAGEIKDETSTKLVRLEDTQDSLEKQILGGLLADSEFQALALPDLNSEEFNNPAIREAIEQFLSAKTWDPDFLSGAVAKEAQFVLESELDSLEGNYTALSRELKKSWFLFKLASLRARLQELSSEIKIAENKGNKTLLLQLNQQFAQASSLRLRYEGGM